MENKKEIINLYEQFKNTPKKLKIVCDWDEVIQVHEPYALWKTNCEEVEKRKEKTQTFPQLFQDFWQDEGLIKYFSYGSRIRIEVPRQIEIKNSLDFYQKAPFLTIAEDLLKLIKEGKVEKLIFLSAYDKRKFPNGEGDMRKYDIFRETFANLAHNWRALLTNERKWNNGIWGGERNRENGYLERINLQLIGFDSETQGQSKADWIKENASDFDIVIDDNPNICKSLVGEQIVSCPRCIFDQTGNQFPGRKKPWKPCNACPRMNLTVIAPHYPAIENQHDERILLIKTSVSDLKKEDFGK